MPHPNKVKTLFDISFDKIIDNLTTLINQQTCVDKALRDEILKTDSRVDGAIETEDYVKIVSSVLPIAKALPEALKKIYQIIPERHLHFFLNPHITSIDLKDFSDTTFYTTNLAEFPRLTTSCHGVKHLTLDVRFEIGLLENFSKLMSNMPYLEFLDLTNITPVSKNPQGDDSDHSFDKLLGIIGRECKCLRKLTLSGHFTFKAATILSIVSNGFFKSIKSLDLSNKVVIEQKELQCLLLNLPTLSQLRHPLMFKALKKVISNSKSVTTFFF